MFYHSFKKSVIGDMCFVFCESSCSLNTGCYVCLQLNCCGPTGTVIDAAKDTCPPGELLEELITKVQLTLNVCID